ncbi:MAG: dihydrolipoyl dehydrogenase [Candidatus Marinamargulisbacteria bacterium]|nr:dihydrolipoyl dehydrogenase [bacterium]MDG2265095.1 dihydrolipoyl dehydrogenase [Candidatus Marinamargulisbacteria bacterium]|tara:strand:+ start:819 stop:2225 length:1407 start_codon:yes stop_codon:yes gene_type:complete
MNKVKTDVVVLGAGPGGYAAAFYAADLGLNVVLVEKEPALGGVCLNRGCIPSKALLHATDVYHSGQQASDMGIQFGKATLDLDQLRTWKNGIVDRLGGGVRQLAATRNVTVIAGRGYFEGSQLLRVETESGQQFIDYDKAIIATGSRPAMPRAFDLGSPRVMTSTEALDIQQIPDSLLVIGGGYIGMELGIVYARMGTSVSVVEATEQLLSGADPDLVRPVEKMAERMFSSIQKSVKVKEMATKSKKIEVVLDDKGTLSTHAFDSVLVSVGRAPNTDALGLENTDVKCDEKGYINVHMYQQTDDPNILAIGDCAGGLLLAHKASKEARIAVEALTGRQPTTEFTVPAVVFTDPELAWVGLTEVEAKASKKAIKVAKFPWTASGRAMTLGRTDGMTKLIVEPDTHRVLGVGIVGPHAGDLISEAAMAIEMQATVEDIAHIVHPHPTLSESMLEAAEVFLGHCTHVASAR